MCIPKKSALDDQCYPRPIRKTQFYLRLSLTFLVSNTKNCFHCFIVVSLFFDKKCTSLIQYLSSKVDFFNFVFKFYKCVKNSFHFLQSKSLSMLFKTKTQHFPCFLTQKLNTFWCSKHRKLKFSVFQTHKKCYW